MTKTLKTKGAADAIDIEAGKVLRALRTMKGFSQDILAKQADVTFQQIQKYENGKNRISIGRLFKLAEGLEIKPSEFLRDLEIKTDTDITPDAPNTLELNKEELQFIGLLRRASNDGLKEAAKTILKSA